MNIRTISAIVLLGLGASVQAEQSPGVREVTAAGRVIVPLTTRIRYTTVIVLPEGEEITDVICGDKDNWVINANANHAFVKPAKEGATTNLNLLTTTGAIHSFTLVESAKAQTDLMLYVMNDPNVAQKPQKYVPASALNDLTAALADIKSDIRLVETRVAAKPQTDDPVTTAATLQFPYAWDTKKSTLGIRQIWHDGQRTYIRSDKPEQGAALYEVTSSGPALVPFDLQDGLYTVTRVLAKGVLVKGKERLEFSATK